MTLPGRRSLLLAAGLCVLSLGLAWSTRPLEIQPGYTTPYTTYSWDGTPDLNFHYWPGSTTLGEAPLGAESDVRVVLVPAAAVFAWAAGRRTVASRRAARIAVVGLLGATLLACSRALPAAALSSLAAAALAARVAWPAALPHRLRAHPVVLGAAP